jgi:hypothetical protein
MKTNFTILAMGLKLMLLLELDIANFLLTLVSV